MLDRLLLMTPGATMKLLLFVVVVLMRVSLLVGIATVGVPFLNATLDKTVQILENPRASE